MGLSSALTTALTGLVAAETKIDVAGNNLANLQTVGFKESDTIFATQLYRTFSFGSSSEDEGASISTNPQQIGLGTQVAAITPNFSQGAIELSSSPSDLAIQGAGFFIVQGGNGEQLYTRSGIFSVSTNNQLVTPTGNQLLGFGVDEQHRIQNTSLVPITIPFGDTADALPTQNAHFEGNLTPTGDIADTAEVIESAVLGNGAIPRANVDGTSVTEAAPLDSSTITGTPGTSGGLTPSSTYNYRFVFIHNNGEESAPSQPVQISTGAGETSIDLAGIPGLPTDYDRVRIYRTEAGGDDYFQVGEVFGSSPTFTDTIADGSLGAQLDETTLDGNYTYMVTFTGPGLAESRPSPLLGPVSVVNGRIQIDDLPSIPTSGAPPWTEVKIYRNLSTDPESFFLVGTGQPGDTFIDGRADQDISDLTINGNEAIDFIGPRIELNTRLLDVVVQNGFSFDNIFTEGELSFNFKKGGRETESDTFNIDDETSIQDLLIYMEESMGVFVPADDPGNPVPNSENNIPGETGTLIPGGRLVNGRLRFVSNNGLVNALEIGGRSISMIDDATGELVTPELGFHAVQEAEGEGSVVDFTAFDSLGVPIDMRITTVLEKRSDTSTVYRWFAETTDNQPLIGSGIGVGTGLITFDGDGNFVNVSNDTVSIQRRGFPSTSPLEFDLDFTSMSGLAATGSVLNLQRQDGSPAGNLTNYVISENGLVQGIYSNGTTRNLGKVQLAVFSNPQGLDQRADNLFAAGVNSGQAFASPGEQGAGQLIAGAVEQSNTDIGRNLIDLSLATTLYRSNSRVISTSQTLLDELLNLRR